MADYTKLQELILQKLDKDGTLNRLRADLSSSIYKSLESENIVEKKSDSSKNAMQEFLHTDDGRMATSLVREFIQFFDMQFTMSVFDPEVGMMKGMLTRFQLCQELQLPYRSDDTPVLARLLKVLKAPSVESSEPPLTYQNAKRQDLGDSNQQRSSHKQQKQRDESPERDHRSGPNNYSQDAYRRSPTPPRVRSPDRISSPPFFTNPYDYDHYSKDNKPYMTDHTKLTTNQVQDIDHSYDKHADSNDNNSDDFENGRTSNPILSFKQIKRNEDKYYRQQHDSLDNHFQPKTHSPDKSISRKVDNEKRRSSKSRPPEEFSRSDIQERWQEASIPIRNLPLSYSHGSLMNNSMSPSRFQQEHFYRRYQTSENKILKSAFNGLVKEDITPSRSSSKDFVVSLDSKKHFDSWMKNK